MDWINVALNTIRSCKMNAARGPRHVGPGLLTSLALGTKQALVALLSYFFLPFLVKYHAVHAVVEQRNSVQL